MTEGICWAWWINPSEVSGHHRCVLDDGHPGLCECCCGAVTEAATRTIP